MTTNRMGLTGQAVSAFTDDDLLEIAHCSSSDDMERELARELLAYREASKNPIAWATEDMRNGDSNVYLLLSEVNTALANNLYLEITSLYAAPPLQAVTIQDGWQLVPTVPTWEMLSEDGCKEHHNGQECSHHDNRRRIWRAMLAAATQNHK